MTTDLLIVNTENIRDKMYYIRNQYVMIDSDLAEIYGYTTKRFNEQVKNNIEKFDKDFMFQLNDIEVEKNLRSKFSTSSLNNNYGGRRYMPYAFTEQGIYMLMTVLKGKKAIEQSKALIRIFKEMKDYLTGKNNFELETELLRLSLQTDKNTENIKNIENNIISIMDNFIDESKYKEFLILDGEKVEGDITFKTIFSFAKKSIFIVDNYIGLKTLVLLKDYNVDIKIFSDNINNHLHKLEYDDFINEYKLNIDFIKTNKLIHDRYIIIDYKTENEKIYHLGASIKDIGNRITTITEINDIDIYHNVINKLLKNNKLIIKR